MSQGSQTQAVLSTDGSASADAGALYADEDRLRAEQVALLYESLPAGLMVALACAVALVAVYWNVAPRSSLWGWLACMMVVTAGRSLLAQAYHRRDQATDPSDWWERAFLVGAGLAGCVWGATAWVLFPETSVPHQLFLAFVLGGITAGSVATLSARFAAFLAFAAPTLLAIGFRFFLREDPQSAAMALYIFLFSLVVTYAAYRMKNTLAQTLALKFQNAALVRQLTGQIAEERQLELLLDVNREHYRFLTEEASDIIYRTDRDGRFSFINDAVTVLLGYGQLEILGHRFTEFIRDDHRQATARFYVRQFVKRIPSTYLEFPLMTKGGGVKWVGQNVQLLERDGTMIGFQAVVRDISDRKWAEQAVQESHHLLEAVIQTAPIRVFWKDRQLRYLGCNHLFAADAGVAGSQALVGKTDFELGWKAQAALHRTGDLAVMESGIPKIGYEEFQSTPDGREICVRTSKVPLRDETGAVIGILGIYDDVTDRKQAEEALRTAQVKLEQRVVERTWELRRANQKLQWTTAHLDTILRESPLAIIELDEIGHVRRWNQAAAKLFGWTEEEVLGREVPYVSADMAEESDRLWASVMKGESVQNREMRRLKKDGTPVDVSFWGRDLYNPDGALIGSIGFLIDISERKRLEAQFRQAQKMEAVGRLAGGVAHDFNNLLTIINGYSALLLDQLPLDDARHEMVQETLSAGQRAGELTKQLLAFSRQQVLMPKPLNLNESLQSIRSMIGRLLGEDITLTLDLDPELQWIQSDKGQFDQVTMNLAVNARDAMPDGGALTIATRNLLLTADVPDPRGVMPAGAYVHVSVRDTGHGMSPETLTHIFEPFFTTKAEGKGTGLGLATVYGIVKQSQGYIFAESELGQGATFHLYFPCLSAPVVEATPRTSRSVRGFETLLVVEDQASVRALVAEALRHQGYRVMTAASGEEAVTLARAAKEPIHILVTDVVMPHMAGPVVAEKLRLICPGLRVLFMSGYTDRAKPVFLSAPGTAFIQKPFLPTDLGQRLRELIDQTM
jgi:two-component system, cell cycle sensor histidine kinase and response regulator CckA